MGIIGEFILGYFISPDGYSKYERSNKSVKSVQYNCQVAVSRFPDDYKIYNADNSDWYETKNKNKIDEIENLEKDLHVSLSRYKVYSVTTKYNDKSSKEELHYPNGNVVTINRKGGFNFVVIKDKSGNVVAEKVFNAASNEGRKTLYKHYKQGDDTFTVVQVFSYDTTQKNTKFDTVDFGYTSQLSSLTNNCNFEKEYYLLNGKEVKAEQTSDSEYKVKNKDGKKLIFKAE